MRLADLILRWRLTWKAEAAIVAGDKQLAGLASDHSLAYPSTGFCPLLPCKRPRGIGVRMTDKATTTNFAYFTSLDLENVRAFGERQKLDLTNNTGMPSQWTLIVGENGVGKTTLLQCLANMRPVRNERQLEDSKSPITAVADPALSQEENEVIAALVRSGGDIQLHLKATLTWGAQLNGTGRSKPRIIETEVSVERRGGKIAEIGQEGTPLRTPALKAFEEPLVIGYGAGRHMGFSNADEVASETSVASLFDSTVELYDAEEILYQLDYAVLKTKTPGAERRLRGLKEALATILPDVSAADDIEINGPRTLGLKNVKSGVHVRTPYGHVPFSSLSLGYQTVSAWTVDIAWRLFQRYPDSADPLSEPAIVLVDEIDLHLHPRWQREIRENLTKHFPNVQFVATAHSPLMAQTYLDANLAVVRREGDQAVIVNDPAVTRDWRLDQIITSDLFGFESARPPEIEKKMRRRVILLRKARRTPAEKKELKTLDHELDNLPTAAKPEDQKALEIIRRAAEALSSRSNRS